MHEVRGRDPDQPVRDQDGLEEVQPSLGPKGLGREIVGKDDDLFLFDLLNHSAEVSNISIDSVSVVRFKNPSNSASYQGIFTVLSRDAGIASSHFE